MLQFDLPSLPTLADLAAATPWAIGGGLAGACCGAIHLWYVREAMRFGPVQKAIGPPPEVPGMPPPERHWFAWQTVARWAAVGSIIGAAFIIATDGFAAAFGALGLVAAIFAVLRAVKQAVHNPAGSVPVGEAPPELDDDNQALVKHGTWAAVGAALVGLAFAAFQALNV